MRRDFWSETVTEKENDASRQSEGQSEQILSSDQSGTSNWSIRSWSFRFGCVFVSPGLGLCVSEIITKQHSFDDSTLKTTLSPLKASSFDFFLYNNSMTSQRMYFMQKISFKLLKYS